jgi:xanthine dehydrogenase YagS FAD-binding subunit
VLGASDACIATYPGDFGQALIALDAVVDVAGSSGRRQIPFADLHVQPGRTPNVETTLAPDDLILGFELPVEPWFRRSLYLKIRDRESYEFALASAAVALDLDGETVRQARIALGGLATVPWRAREAEQALVDRTLDEANCQLAAEVALSGAHPREHNAFKVELGRRTLVRALLQAAAMEV